jgi:outer membrane protein assembly factor BamB
MNENHFYKTILLLSLLGVIFIQSCVKEKNLQTSSSEIRPQHGELLVSPASLRQAELEIDWSYVVPIQPSERLKSFTILDDRLYAVSTQNYLVSLDRNKAQPVYSWQLAPPAAVFCSLKNFDGQIYSIIGADLVALDSREGTELMRKPIDFGSVCPPARNNSFYYVPGTDKRIHVMRSADMVPLFEVSANDGGNITCVTARDDFVVFATDAGTLAAMLPNWPVQLWRFGASDAINGPVIYDGRRFIFSAKDAYIYAVDRSRGGLLWKYLTPAILTDAPKVTQQYVYQYVSGHGLLAINKADGTLAWRLPEGIDLLAEDGRRVYVMADKSKLIVFDNQNLKKLHEVEMPGVTKWAANTLDERIYLADDSGRIACIKPIKY